MNHLVGAGNRTLSSVEPFLQVASLELRAKLRLAFKLQLSCIILLRAKITLRVWFSCTLNHPNYSLCRGSSLEVTSTACAPSVGEKRLELLTSKDLTLPQVVACSKAGLRSTVSTSNNSRLLRPADRPTQLFSTTQSAHAHNRVSDWSSRRKLLQRGFVFP